ncbi:hypothetical protein [Rubrobacter calidifluminis]|uniref:hypothetical protein n=1 Tax=Rubrobacter calidifluminis TaxID=1392640 RepID=UPI002362A543|nr:hypothetical protein [Rubrobacter calidifluminis]
MAKEQAAKEEQVVVQINPAFRVKPERVYVAGKFYEGGEVVSASEYEELKNAQDPTGKQLLVKTQTAS